jgi:hypothetical protein
MMKKRDQKPNRQGDVLGLSDVPPNVSIPRATSDRGGHPAGIEITPKKRESAFQQGKGATGIDMGAGGEGTGIEP